MGDMITKAIDGLFLGWAKNVLGFFIDICSDIVDNVSHNLSGISTWYKVFLGCSASLAVVVVLGRVFMTALKQADESTDVTWSNIVLDAIKSGASIPVMTFLQGLLQKDVILPILKIIFSINKSFTVKNITSLNKVGSHAISGFTLIMLTIFFVIVMCFFFVKMCVYYVEMIWFNITIPLVAVSMATETFDYGSTWWKKLVYYNMTIFFQVLSLTLMVLCFENIHKGFWFFMGTIGFGITTIRPPFVMDQFWASTGMTKGGTRNMARMGGRLIGNGISSLFK